MKVICIDNEGCPELVIGHIYDVEEYPSGRPNLVDVLQFKKPNRGELFTTLCDKSHFSELKPLK